jgi:hypothetical protein
MPPRKFTLTCEVRDDGGLRVSSDQIHGLILSGADPREVLRDVWPAVLGLEAYLTGRTLCVTPDTPAEQVPIKHDLDRFAEYRDSSG